LMLPAEAYKVRSIFHAEYNSGLFIGPLLHS